MKLKQSGMDELNREIIKLNAATRLQSGIRFTICKVCMECYDEIDRRVSALVPCGHTVCAHCLKLLIRCPICQLKPDQTVRLYNN